MSSTKMMMKFGVRSIGNAVAPRDSDSNAIKNVRKIDCLVMTMSLVRNGWNGGPDILPAGLRDVDARDAANGIEWRD